MGKKEYPMPQEVVDILWETPESELPRMWYELNGWQWPKELGDPPKDWVVSERYINKEDADIKRRYSTPIMEYIEFTVGLKACLRYSNVERGTMTNQMFDDWWECEKRPKYSEYDTISEQNSVPTWAWYVTWGLMLAVLISTFL